MTQETKNLLLAIALSLLVVMGWNAFYTTPQLEKERQIQAHMRGQQQATQAVPGQTTGAPGSSGAPTPGPAIEKPPIVKSRPEALAESPRVKLATASLEGSIALKGARIDDIALKDYRETTDRNSPNIVLLSPVGSAAPYYAEAGFVAEPSANLALPRSDTLWTADRDTLTATTPVTLTYDNGHGLVFRRKISVDDRYMFTLADSVENKSGQSVTFSPYALVARQGTPKTSGFMVLHEGFVGLTGDAGLQELKYDKIEKEEKATKSFSGTGGWVGFADKYWAATVIPDQSKPIEASFAARGSEPAKVYRSDFVREPITLAPGATVDVTTRVFAGAKETDTLDKYQDDLGITKFDLLIDWGWFYFMTKPMFWMIDFFYKFTGNFGIAILCITVFVKAIFFPLANRSYMSIAKMKAVQPELLALKERYPDDKHKQQTEMMALYRREKINPVSGCLPMLIQIPVFFALYKVLFITIEMRQAPFFGWIKDLSAPDPTNIFNLLGLLPFDPTHIPVFGPYLAIGIWPLIMGVSMFIQMKMNPEPTDEIQKQVFAWMPVLFTFTLGSFASGLVIYWTWNNLLSVLQQGLIMKRAGVKIELWDNLASIFRKKPRTT
jgi:YidC/Oxa1 family membrane protein insertase